MKQYLKPCAHEQSEHLYGVTACLLYNEPASRWRGARLTEREPERKRALTGRLESRAADAKPGELSVGRLKRG